MFCTSYSINKRKERATVSTSKCSKESKIILCIYYNSTNFWEYLILFHETLMPADIVLNRNKSIRYLHTWRFMFWHKQRPKYGQDSLHICWSSPFCLVHLHSNLLPMNANIKMYLIRTVVTYLRTCDNSSSMVEL